MVNLKSYKGFCHYYKDRSPEIDLLRLNCTIHKIPVTIVFNRNKCPDNLIPCGKVEWCLKSFNREVIPDYYPEWLNCILYRKVWKTEEWPIGQKVFIKPADKYKRFNGFITSGNKKKKPPFWCSEIINFKNEWRYYIIAGKVMSNGWYLGDGINTPEAPNFPVEIPKKYYGVVDLGETCSGKLALVEAQHPFACGWYNKNGELYLKWLIESWDYMILNYG